MPQTRLQPFQNEGLFSRHFLEERMSDFDEWDCDEEAEKAFNQISGIFEKNPTRKNDNEKDLQKDLVIPILEEVLGHSTTVEATIPGTRGRAPDIAVFPSEKEKQEAKINESIHEDAPVITEVKEWGTKFDQDIEGEPIFDNKNPAYQTYWYLDNTEAEWAILTDGKKWRLYYTEEARLDRYYEVDLESLLADGYTDDFKYFYLFFRKDSMDSAVSEVSFLERVYTQALEFAKGLEDDLSERVYKALRVAVNGFFNSPQNDLELNEQNLEIAHDAALIFMYRIIFIMYAESRDLLPIDNKEYREKYGLTHLYSVMQRREKGIVFIGDTPWNRIQKLSSFINEGVNKNGLSIPAYNGGLFEEKDKDSYQFLQENVLDSSYVEEILTLLGVAEDEEGNDVRLDYKDLDIRHLGSIYEGLLEYTPKIADERMIVDDGEWVKADDSDKEFSEAVAINRAEENEIYLATDKGERKATGSYYTPQYVVEYITRETVEPLVQERISKAEENGESLADAILDLKVCDPAMGSGHFLVETVSLLATHLIDDTDWKAEGDVDAFHEAKRQVVKHCVYGVDINPMATQLAKLSLWLETASKNRPLSFLDHHLKTGNSLIGSNIEGLNVHPSSAEERKDQVSTSWIDVDIEEIKNELRNRYQEIEDLPEETLDEVKKKEQEYEEFVNNHDVYTNLKQLADIHTYQQFNSTLSPDRYSNITKQVSEPQKWQQYEEEEFFKDTLEHAKKQKYFHWELEFPDVFFRPEEGFDALVGNPPYGADLSESQKDFIDSRLELTEGREDTYKFFVELGLSLLRENGGFAYIIPNSWLYTETYEPFRKELLKYNIQQLVIPQAKVFGDAIVETTIPIITNTKSSNSDRTLVRKLDFHDSAKDFKERNWVIDKEINLRDVVSEEDTSINVDLLGYNDVVEKIENQQNTFDDAINAGSGLQAYHHSEHTEDQIDNRVFHSDEKEGKDYLPQLKGSDIGRYILDRDSGDWIKYGEWLYAPQNERYFSGPRILVQQITKGMASRVNATYTEEDYAFNASITVIWPDDAQYPLKALLGILNSALIGWYYPLRLSPKHVRPTDIRKIPLPEYNSSFDTLDNLVGKRLDKQEEFKEEKKSFLSWIAREWSVDIDNISLKTRLRKYWEEDFDGMVEIAKRNKSSIDGDPSSLEFQEHLEEGWTSSLQTINHIQDEIRELETKIDASVFGLYGLDPDEIETVLNSLDASEERIKAVVDKC